MKNRALICILVLGGTIGAVAAGFGGGPHASAPPQLLAQGSFDGKDIVLTAIAIFGAGFGLLSRYRQGRKDLAEELQMEIGARTSKEAAARMPQPLEVREVVEYATRDQLSEVRREVEALRKENKSEMDKLAQQLSRNETAERSRLDELGEKVSELAQRIAGVETAMGMVAKGLENIQALLMVKGGQK